VSHDDLSAVQRGEGEGGANPSWEKGPGIQTDQRGKRQLAGKDGGKKTQQIFFASSKKVDSFVHSSGKGGRKKKKRAPA